MEFQIYIFGAGNNGKSLLMQLENNEIEISAFIDNDEKKQNTKICGLECLSPEKAAQRGVRNSVVLISLNQSSEIKNQLKKLGFHNVFCAANWLYLIPNIFNKSDYSKVVPFNHYESPYPDILEIHKNEKEIFCKEKEILGINFNVNRQLELIKKMERIKSPDWSQDKNIKNGNRYFYNNEWFGKGSADALYYMIQILKPKTIIEVGSGYSTAAMLDTNEKSFENKIKIISIEPRPERLKKLLKPNDKCTIYSTNLQEISLNFFEKLEQNDILFIDSSHVSKINSDVNYILFEILPRLKNGVYIHFHDIIYPFIYPKEWIYEGRAYTETYLLRAFLMNNDIYSIQFFGEMLSQRYNDKILPKLKGCGIGSLWIKKEK